MYLSNYLCMGRKRLWCVTNTSLVPKMTPVLHEAMLFSVA